MIQLSYIASYGKGRDKERISKAMRIEGEQVEEKTGL
jgi:hypothetical protein